LICKNIDTITISSFEDELLLELESSLLELELSSSSSSGGVVVCAH
jgi:hypothetical protein